MSDPSRWTERSRLLGIVVWVAILGVAASLRFWGIADRELWYDENCTYYIVHHLPDWPEGGPPFEGEVGHIPYFLLLRAWTWLLGETVFGLRSLSAVLGVITVALLGGLAAMLAGRRAGLIAALLAAVHPLHIHYSQEARSYTAWMLVITAAIYALYRAATTLRLRWWAVYVLVAWLAFTTHYYTLLWLPGTIAAIWLAGDRRRFAKQWLIAGVTLAAMCAPIIWYLVIPFSQHGPRPWFRETWLNYPPQLAIFKSIWAMLPSGDHPDYLGSLSIAAEVASATWDTALKPVLHWTPATLVAILAVVTLSRTAMLVFAPVNRFAVRDSAGQRLKPGSAPCGIQLAWHGRCLAWLLLMTVAFLAAALLTSALIAPAYIVARYDLAAWPSLVLTIALVLEAAARVPCHSSATPGESQPMPIADLRSGGVPEWIGNAVVLCLCLCSLATVAGMRMAPVVNSHRERAAKIAASVGPKDLVISMNDYRMFILHELERLRAAFEIVSFPPRQDRQLCWRNAEAELSDAVSLEQGIEQIISRVRTAFQEHRRVWILAHGQTSGPQFEVDRRLFARLQREGYDFRLAEDEGLGLAELISR